MRIFIERVYVVRPELNPRLHLEEPLYTRPGLSHPVDDALRERIAMRSIEHALRSKDLLDEPFVPVLL